MDPYVIMHACNIIQMCVMQAFHDNTRYKIVEFFLHDKKMFLLSSWLFNTIFRQKFYEIARYSEFFNFNQPSAYVYLHIISKLNDIGTPKSTWTTSVEIFWSHGDCDFATDTWA